MKISLLALIKMLHHGTKGGIIEVMGYLRGKVAGDTFYIMDAYPLPVEGTETRVNAGNEALEYTGQFEDLNEVRKIGRFLVAIFRYFLFKFTLPILSILLTLLDFEGKGKRCWMVSHSS